MVYLVLTFFYQSYLTTTKNQVDFFTKNVSELSETAAQFFGMNYKVQKDNANEQYKVIYNKNYQIRIIEGCNAISVIILFIAFVVAFSSTFKATFLFILGGSLLVYVLNIFRIVLLTYLFYAFPEYEHFLHGVLFPLIIYGIVFLLWVFWIIKYSKYATK